MVKSLGKFLIPFVGILLVVIAVLSFVKQRVGSQGGIVHTGQTQIALGTVLPDLVLTDSDGKSSALSALQGKVTLINFWASWCEACLTEMPSLVALHNAYKTKGLNVVFVNVDEFPDSAIPKFKRQFKIDFPVYVDKGSKLAELFDVHAIPLTTALDHSRRVLVLESGEQDWNSADFRKLLDGWLGL